MTTQNQPLAYALSVGNAASAQILPSNPSRRGLIFFNPSAAATVWFCPATTNTGAALAAAANGAGSISLAPGAMLILPQAGMTGQNIGLGQAWNAIASANNTPFTVWEF